ncbi:MAG: pyridoxamine 5'-phosphate oxidase family protein [Methylobacterium mesophilicum]|nr:pyridoxamine 5'-phosphate oxidase family protein [Methylobacterium mesophilicum]
MSKYGELPTEEAKTRIWESAEKIGICMFVTWDGERQRARPVAARPHRDEDALYVLTDLHGQKDDQIERFPKVTLAFADNGANTYVSITGHATVSNDRAKIKELWSVFDKIFWDGPEDPSIRLITVKPDDAEIWDGVGRVRAGIAMAAKLTTGAELHMGSNKKVDDL